MASVAGEAAAKSVERTIEFIDNIRSRVGEVVVGRDVVVLTQGHRNPVTSRHQA